MPKYPNSPDPRRPRNALDPDGFSFAAGDPRLFALNPQAALIRDTFSIPGPLVHPTAPPTATWEVALYDEVTSQALNTSQGTLLLEDAQVRLATDAALPLRLNVRVLFIPASVDAYSTCTVRLFDALMLLAVPASESLVVVAPERLYMLADFPDAVWSGAIDPSLDQRQYSTTDVPMLLTLDVTTTEISAYINGELLQTGPAYLPTNLPTGNTYVTIAATGTWQFDNLLLATLAPLAPLAPLT